MTMTGTLTVKVIDNYFPPPISAWKERARTWDCPAIKKDSFIESDADLTFTDSAALSGGGRRFSVRLYEPRPKYVVARLGAGGPVLDSTAINGFDTQNANTRLLVVYPDGSQLVESGVVFTGTMAPDLVFQFNIFVAGVTFDDGTLVRNLSPSAFDSLGRAWVRLIRPAAARTSVCHNLKVYQNGILIGTL